MMYAKGDDVIWHFFFRLSQWEGGAVCAQVKIQVKEQVSHNKTYRPEKNQGKELFCQGKDLKGRRRFWEQGIVKEVLSKGSRAKESGAKYIKQSKVLSRGKGFKRKELWEETRREGLGVLPRDAKERNARVIYRW